jgi:hypothetical protein
VDRAIVNAPEASGDGITRPFRRWVVGNGPSILAVLFSAAACLMNPGLSGVYAADADPNSMTAAWDAVYQGEGIQVEAGQTPPAVFTSRRGTRWDSFLDYMTVAMGSEYVYNWIDYSGKPTISFISENGPGSDPNVFPDDDQKFNWYGSVGTVGAGHSRLNTYVSGVYRRDLDDQALGSPFQNVLNGFSDGDKGNLQNGWAEMNGLAATGFFSKTNARLGRVFVPYTFPGIVGSPAMDGGRVSYDDSRNEVNAFVGRWEPFYDGVSAEAILAGGSVSRQLFPKWGPKQGIAPFAELLYFDDTGGGSSAKHIYGFRSWWEMLTLDGFFAWVGGDPVDIGVQSTFTADKLNVYGKVHKKLTTDDYKYDVFLKADDDLNDRRRLNIGSVQKWLDVTLDADYQVCKWLSVGSGIWARALDHEDDQQAYQNSFIDVNGRLLFTPHRDINAGVQYRYRDVRRRSPQTTTFDDIQTAGETEYNEVNGEIRYRWEDWRFNVGGYLGLYDTQDWLTKIHNTTSAGGYAQTRAYLTDAFSLRFMFLVDRGNDQFTPDIDTQYSFRTGFDFYY